MNRRDFLVAGGLSSLCGAAGCSTKAPTPAEPDEVKALRAELERLRAELSQAREQLRTEHRKRVATEAHYRRAADGPAFMPPALL